MIAAWNTGQIFEEISDYWFPRVIGESNGQLIKAAKFKGELAWHAHEEEDELFLVVKGALRIEFEDDVAELKQGDLLNIPRGVRHNPVAREEC